MKNKKGYTLIETIAAVFISLIAATVVYEIFSTSLRVNEISKQDIKDDKYTLIEYMKRDINSLSFLDVKPIFIGSKNILKMGCIDFRTGEKYVVIYEIVVSNGINLVKRTVMNDNKNSFLEMREFNLKDISFYFYNKQSYYEFEWNFEEKMSYPNVIKIVLTKNNNSFDDIYIPVIIGRVIKLGE